MRSGELIRMSILAGLLNLVCVATLLYYFQAPWLAVLPVLGVMMLINVVIFRFLLKEYVMKPIRHINRKIEDAIKNKRYKQQIEEATPTGLDRLDRSVSYLIREKTSEIDNLRELEEYRKEFLGNVAHELRSPIFNVQGYVHTLLEGAWEDPGVSHRFLEKAGNNIDHLCNLVEDLMTISKIESGQLKLEKAAFDLKELIQEVNDLVDLPAKQKNITITVKNEEEHLLVMADRPKIKQVLINLISNSIKYGREGGQTTIKLTDEGRIIAISIADNGEGIPEEHLPRIFERFYRVDKSRSRQQQSSTGLGLAIVKHFVEAHGHTIETTSHEGVGSIFSFRLDKG